MDYFFYQNYFNLCWCFFLGIQISPNYFGFVYDVCFGFLLDSAHTFFWAGLKYLRAS